MLCYGRGDIVTREIKWTVDVGSIGGLAMLAGWVGGIAAAKGFWATLGCVIFPPYAWVVLAEGLLA